jgi:hypothetical protein
MPLRSGGALANENISTRRLVGMVSVGAKPIVAKAVVFQSGFETGDYSEWSRTDGLGTVLFIDSLVKYEGNYSSRTEGDSFYAGYGIDQMIDTGLTLQTGKWYKIRLQVFVDATDGYVKLYVDDVLAASKTSCNTTGMLRVTAGSATSMWMTGLAKRKEWVDSIKVDEP